MAVHLPAPVKSALLPVAGVRLATVSAGIKEAGRKDVVLIELAEGSRLAGMYTQNAFCAAPVLIAKAHQQQSQPRFLLVNAGNANAGTGEAGMQAAYNCCARVAELADVSKEQVLPFSTGIIGQQLPVTKITAALPQAFSALSEHGWYDAAHGIMTTDTIAKAKSVQLEIDGYPVTVTGIAKGSGMICPDMATMLAYIATDAAVSQPVLEKMLRLAVEQSFNRITVDGDTSTNDACMLVATAQVQHAKIGDISSNSAQALLSVIEDICSYLARAIVRDGEGATKFVTIAVDGGLDVTECRQVAYTIAHSPLVKTALFASDPNWGRILAAVGRSGIKDFDLEQVSIYLNDVCLVHHGQPSVDYTDEKGQAVMKKAEIVISVNLGRGKAAEQIWTCDLSYDYVKINAEYRS